MVPVGFQHIRLLNGSFHPLTSDPTLFAYIAGVQGEYDRGHLRVREFYPPFTASIQFRTWRQSVMRSEMPWVPESKRTKRIG